MPYSNDIGLQMLTNAAYQEVVKIEKKEKLMHSPQIGPNGCVKYTSFVKLKQLKLCNSLIFDLIIHS